MSRSVSFFARGGGWVVAQVPLLLIAFLLPLWTTVTGTFASTFKYPGIFLLLTSVVIVIAGLVSLGSALTPFPQPRRGSALVTRGIYAYVRHPIYSGLIVASLGWALFWTSPIGVAYTVVVAAFFDRKASYEEVWLRKCYSEYSAYAKRVRRLLPGVY